MLQKLHLCIPCSLKYKKSFKLIIANTLDMVIYKSYTLHQAVMVPGILTLLMGFIQSLGRLTASTLFRVDTDPPRVMFREQ